MRCRHSVAGGKDDAAVCTTPGPTPARPAKPSAVDTPCVAGMAVCCHKLQGLLQGVQRGLPLSTALRKALNQLADLQVSPQGSGSSAESSAVLRLCIMHAGRRHAAIDWDIMQSKGRLAVSERHPRPVTAAQHPGTSELLLWVGTTAP